MDDRAPLTDRTDEDLVRAGYPVRCELWTADLDEREWFTESLRWQRVAAEGRAARGEGAV